MPLCVGDVGEVQRPRAVGMDVEVVPKESPRQGPASPAASVRECLPLQHEHVEVAVVVVVEQRHARSQDFGIVRSPDIPLTCVKRRPLVCGTSENQSVDASGPVDRRRSCGDVRSRQPASETARKHEQGRRKRQRVIILKPGIS